VEPESSLPHSQAPATCPYPEPTPSSPPPTSWRSILILSSHLSLSLPNGLFPSGFPTRTLCTPLPNHQIINDQLRHPHLLQYKRLATNGCLKLNCCPKTAGQHTNFGHLLLTHYTPQTCAASIPVSARLKACICCRSIAGIAGSNPEGCMESVSC
jgi:hypothetical protein